MEFPLNQEDTYKGLKKIFDRCSSQEKSYVRPLLRLYNSSFQNLLLCKSFCFWKYETNAKRTKLSKVPYFYRHSKFVKADIRNSMDWLTGLQVVRIMLSDIHEGYEQGRYSHMNGIGIILTDSPFFAIDLDHCIDAIDGSLTDIAQSIVDQFKDTYIEISPSGQGLHIFGIGSLNLNGRSKSPKYPNVEAYDCSSVRYMTFTGHRLFETGQRFCSYNTSCKEVVQWFKETFFPKPVHPQFVHPHSLVTSEHQASEVESVRHLQNHGEDLYKDFEVVMKRIHEPKDHIVFSKLIKQMRLSKSPSEDDLIFCSIIVTHTQDYDLDLQRTLVKKMLLKFRYRSKLKRHDYLDRTFMKARNILKKKNSLLQKQHSSKLLISDKDNQTSVPAEHILRIDPLIHSIFNLTHIKKDQVLEAQIRQDSDNYVVVSSPDALDVTDLSVYLCVLILLKKQLAQSQESVAFSPTDYWYFSVELKEFSEIMRQCNNNHFCKKVLSSIQRLANVKIQYQKTLKKCSIKGGNSLLSWAYAQHGSNYLRLGVNYFVCTVLLGASKNYRLLNTDVFFQLSSLPYRWLYHFMVNKVFPSRKYPFRISIEELTHLMRGLLGKENQVTERTRKSKVRKMCQQLLELQPHLVDFDISLEYSFPKHSSFSVVSHLVLKRKRVKLD